MKPTAFILTILLVTGCVSHDLESACDVRDPVEELAWLNDEISSIGGNEDLRKFWYVTQGRYRDETVFIIHNCCPTCLSLPAPVYNCTGEQIFDAADERYQKIKGQRVIWKTPDCPCNI